MNFIRKISSLRAKFIQSRYDLTAVKEAKRLIIFMIPFLEEVNGGVMSIFSLCRYSRTVVPNAVSVLCTEPGRYTYARNRKFLNDEKIYNFEQILKNCKNAKEVIIHVPEYLATKFYRHLNQSQKEILEQIPDLRINILNQNIELMPPYEDFKSLYNLTTQITQTTAHDRYATQEICDRFKVPLHLFSVYIDVSRYKTYPFEQKEKLLVLSPDANPYRQTVIEAIAKELPEYRMQTVQNLTFEEYMDLIARGFAVISFGEGYDGYFIQPWYVKTMSFAVYNDNFFPSKQWREKENVYSSYPEMIQKLPADIRHLEQDKTKYYQLIEEAKAQNEKIYSFAKFSDNLDRFYRRQYDFYPDK